MSLEYSEGDACKGRKVLTLLVAAQNGGVLVVKQLAELGASVNAAGAFGK